MRVHRLTVISLVLLVKVNDRFPYPRNFFRYIRMAVRNQIYVD